jgi:hypothetical protein
MDITSIEGRFTKLGNLWAENGIQVNLFEDKSRASSFELLTNLFRLLDNTSEIFDQLKLTLSHLHWDLRGFVGTSKDSSSRWGESEVKLKTELARVKNNLPLEAQEIAVRLLESLTLLKNEDSSYSQKLESQLLGDDHIILVTEKPRLSGAVSNFVDSLDTSNFVSVISLSTLVRFEVPNGSKVIILAAPRKISNNFMRVLALGAPVGSLTFIAPNWLAGMTPQKITQDLASGLPGVKKPIMRVSGPIFSHEMTAKEVEQFEETYLLSQEQSYKKYSSHGDVKCRLLHLAGGFVMPIEIGATRISVLAQNAYGNLEVKSKKPFTDLENGDIIFDLRNGVDDTFLTELAEARMGVNFAEYSHIRGIMKKRLKQIIQENGRQATIEKLLRSKVSTARYVDDWLNNQDFTTLRSKADWHNLLVFLKFSAAEVKRFEDLGTELRSTLISIGASARLQMAESVSARELEMVLEGQIVTKKLDDYGDADFVIGLVTGIDDNESLCEQDDIRKVMEG